MSGLIDYQMIEQHVAMLTFNRPDKMNALSIDLLHELQAYMTQLEQEEKVRVVIVTGAGNKAFCAGADLKERRGMSETETVQTVKHIGMVINKLSALPVPVIAAVNGVAFGGGLELALACDFRLFAREAKVGLTETSLGIIPGAGGTQRLSRLIGTGQAKKLIFTAQVVTAEEAHELGIAEIITGQQGLMEEAIRIARQIAQNSPIAVKQAKAAINDGIETDLHTALNIEHTHYQHTIPTADRMEGLQAFQEKRKPQYQGK